MSLLCIVYIANHGREGAKPAKAAIVNLLLAIPVYANFRFMRIANFRVQLCKHTRLGSVLFELRDSCEIEVWPSEEDTALSFLHIE